MKIGPGQYYQIIEFDKGIVLTDIGQRMKGATPLAVVDVEALSNYLPSYLSARESGKPVKEAHELALEVARLPKVRKL
jgi:hypothetical protein